MHGFSTSIRVPENTAFGATITKDTLFISLDGTFTDSTIVLKMTLEDWGRLVSVVRNRIIEGD